jgi:hypothetical protein
VVLPDATRFTTDLVTVEESPIPQPVLYYLLPHFGQVEVAGGKVALNVTSFGKGGGMALKDGDILNGIRLQVVNAIDQEMYYADDQTHNLREFVPNYTLSNEVVLNGRAACYFDLYGGNVSTRVVKGGAKQTLVEMTTDGPPELLVTPLAPATTPVRSARLPLGDDLEIWLDVKNLEACHQEEHLDHQGGAFDFLLHYLTATGGIPQSIKQVLPGMEHHNLVSATREDLARTLHGLADMLMPRTRRTLVSPEEATPSCSDSQYP